MTDSSDHMGARKQAQSEMQPQNGLLKNRLDAVSQNKELALPQNINNFPEPSEGIEEAFLALIQSNEKGPDLSQISPQFNTAKTGHHFETNQAGSFQNSAAASEKQFMAQNGAASLGFGSRHDPFEQPSPPEAIFASDREMHQPVYTSPFAQPQSSQNKFEAPTGAANIMVRSEPDPLNNPMQQHSALYNSPFDIHHNSAQPNSAANHNVGNYGQVNNTNYGQPNYTQAGYSQNGAGYFPQEYQQAQKNNNTHLKSFQEEQQHSYYGGSLGQSGMGYASDGSRGSDYSHSGYNQNSQSQYYAPVAVSSQPYQDSGAFETSRALEVVKEDAGYVPQTGLVFANHGGFENGAEESYADPEFQALVQWSQSDVDHSRHHQYHGHGGNDMPNFLAYKQERGSKFNAKTVLLTTLIVTGIMGGGYFVYELGQQKGQQKFVDVTPTSHDASESKIAANENSGAKQKTRALAANDKNQPAAQPKPEILEFVVDNVAGSPGDTIPMHVRLAGTNLKSDMMLLFSKVPDTIKLSKGAKRDGVWSVTAGDLEHLALVIPQDYKGGSFDFEVYAFATRESKSEQRRASVKIEPMVSVAQVEQPSQDQSQSQSSFGQQPGTRSFNQGAQPKAQDRGQQKVAQLPPASMQETQTNTNEALNNAGKQSDQGSETQQQSNSSVPRELEAKTIKRANGLLRDGDVAGARLLFEHLATQGSKHAAYSLARTYDEEYLNQIVVRGLKADMNMAVKWYKEAAQMGNQEAVTRLDQLGQR